SETRQTSCQFIRCEKRFTTRGMQSAEPAAKSPIFANFSCGTRLAHRLLTAAGHSLSKRAQPYSVRHEVFTNIPTWADVTAIRSRDHGSARRDFENLVW